jgi:diguanylate cyclase (GGDEF)-like protein/PAS domain S-box-containing protein
MRSKFQPKTKRISNWFGRFNPVEKIGLTPASRLAIGLVSLTISILLMLDLTLGIMPNRAEVAKRVRQATAESLAVQVTTLLQDQGTSDLIPVLQQVVQRNTDVASIGLRTEQGRLVMDVGDHVLHWTAPPADRSTIDDLRVPIYSGKDRWGTIEIAFHSVYPETIWGWFKEPLVLGVFALAALAFVSFYLYLRRALQYLDPASAVPERVRTAFDTLTEGILVLDVNGRIVLANQVFRAMVPGGAANVTGKAVNDLRWFVEPLANVSAQYPWEKALETGVAVEIESFLVKETASGVNRTFVLKASPILDNQQKNRGCLVTLDDVTNLHQTNRALESTLANLQVAQAQVEKQNDELRWLASRDPLTGCLNRRAFFEQIKPIADRINAKGGQITCLMGDIDHFKSFNDRFGHAVGDQVLRTVSKILIEGAGEGALVCRTGGEEFCLMFDNTDLAFIKVMGEKLRVRIEREGGLALNIIKDLKITASFGVVHHKGGDFSPEQFIDQSDQALYAAKQNGRNRVAAWPLDEAEIARLQSKPPTVRKDVREGQENAKKTAVKASRIHA